MGFSFRGWVGWQLIVLSWATLAVAETGDNHEAEITVLVFDSANVSHAVMNLAERETARIFRAAGVQITWVACPSGVVVEDACRQPPGDNQFVLHVVPTGKTSSDWVLGEAFLGQDGEGKYCDIFFDRIHQDQGNFGVDLPPLLGSVTAHELGHLLLGSHSHSNSGIMMPVWKGQGFRQIGMGTLLFTHEQSLAMKARVSHAKRARLVSAGARAGEW
jgi:hypothetical protein